MLLKMLETKRGSEDGFPNHQYHEGCIYNVADTLACQFVNNGWAVDADTSTNEQRFEEFSQYLKALRERKTS
jgi:hypothetical protein